MQLIKCLHLHSILNTINEMETIRKIVSVGMLSPIINLPWKKDMQVEVTIMPIKEENNNQTISFKKLKGCLKKYANPALWEKEQFAWENNIVEKYGTI